MPEGRIFDISEDFVLMDDRALYRVKCHLEETSLTLKNGSTGRLKKGMTFQAHCHVVNRTLLQILRDRTDKWINPLAHAAE